MIEASNVPQDRLFVARDRAPRAAAEFVLYWMIGARRVRWNFGLQRAIDWARELDLPLLVLEPLRVDYRWASDRIHRFVLDGMIDNLRRLESSPIAYYPWVEPAHHAGKDLLPALAARAAVVVTDDTPMFFLPAMVAAAAERVDTRMDAVDGIGLLPVRSTEAPFKTAHSFRRLLQRELPAHLDRLPEADATDGVELPELAVDLDEMVDGYRRTTLEALEDPHTLAALPIDHEVAPTGAGGGAEAAALRLRRFVDELLGEYGDGRMHPDEERASHLSPYLHFGHVSSHEIFATVAAEDCWSTACLADSTDGARAGWWGMSAGAEAYLDQLVTWRELGFNMCHHREDYEEYESLPRWARQTLEEHGDDERPYLYSLGEFEAAGTHDELWNAAQTQLVVEGRMHNYLRMLWGKKILEWTPTPQAALEVMIELNNKYALDGRDPNSYSGIFWTLGRYDRAWGPERPVYGKVRAMTSASARRKLRLRKYLERYRPDSPQLPQTATC